MAETSNFRRITSGLNAVATAVSGVQAPVQNQNNPALQFDNTHIHQNYDVQNSEIMQMVSDFGLMGQSPVLTYEATNNTQNDLSVTEQHRQRDLSLSNEAEYIDGLKNKEVHVQDSLKEAKYGDNPPKETDINEGLEAYEEKISEYQNIQVTEPNEGLEAYEEKISDSGGISNGGDGGGQSSGGDGGQSM